MLSHQSRLTRWVCGALISASCYSPAAAWTTTRTTQLSSCTSRLARRQQHLTPTTTTTTLFAATENNSRNKYNVVLEPSDSDNSKAFDNYQIGNARVHRYSNDDTSDETEYVMWYHGRSHALHSDSNNVKLPPLSTGRIGRATSRNGLVWEKDTVGSVSEDADDVSLGLNQESWWGFDTQHVGLGNVLLPLSTPAVMTEGGVYLMYYMGGSGEETAVADYTTATLPEELADATLQGMRMKIGVALSQDGKTWGRIEGDDPSGACMTPYDTSDPNLEAKLDIDEELYCAWPEVVVNVSGKKTDDKSEAFLMYYSTMTKEDKQKSIAYAVSEDGFRWYKRGVTLTPDADSLDTNGCARCCVFKDAVFDDETNTWTELENSWKMYYEGVGNDNKHRILMASSTDGMAWNKVGLALDVGEDEANWDFGGVGSPHVVRLDDGTCRMYYTGQAADGSTAVGVAKLQGGNSEWVREQATISFATIED